MRITIIGCGNGAFAAAADLSSRGHEITMYADEAHAEYFDAIRKKKTIKCSGAGPQGEVPIHEITNDIEKALAEAELIMPIITANAHEAVAEELAPHLKDYARILLVPGSTGGALVFEKVFREKCSAKDVRIAEMHTLPYACRKYGGKGKAHNGIYILLNVELLFVAAFPAKYNEEMFAIASDLYPASVMCRDVLETSLNNGNATTHPAPVVLNAGKIEYYGKHYHYEEGITPSVARVIQTLDDERKAICRRFGYAELDIKDRLYQMGYTTSKENVYDAIHSSNEVFLPLEGPNDLNGRYLVEDAPCSLAAMANIARMVRVKTPTMNGVVDLAGALKGEDYWADGRTLKRMGIDHLTYLQLRHYLDTGELPKHIERTRVVAKRIKNRRYKVR